MLAHWYFCCCVDLSRRQQEFLLASMGILANPPGDERLLRLTLNELAQADLWVQAYCLADALAARRSLPEPQRLAPELQGLFVRVRSHLSEELQGDVRHVTDLVLSSMGSSEELETALQAIFRKGLAFSREADHPRTETPYLDTETFLPIILLLTFLSDQREIAVRFLDGEEKGDLEYLLSQAVRHQFGRQALLLAYRIIFQHPGRFPLPQLWEEIRQSPETTPAVEPDLAKIAATLFLRIADDPMVACREELATFKNFLCPEATWTHRLKEALERAGADVLWRLDAGLPREEVQGWAFFCRQWALLAALVAMNPTDLAGLLADIWKPALFDTLERPNHFVRMTVQIDRPTSESNYTSSALKSGANFLGLHINFSQQRTRHTLSEFAPYLCSPWIPKIFKGTFSWRRERTNPATMPPAMLLRLAAGAVLAVDLLRQGGKLDPLRRNFLAAFLAHAARYLEVIYHQWRGMRRKENIEDSLDLPGVSKNLEGVVRASRGCVLQAGAGHYETIPPELFLTESTDDCRIASLIFLQYNYVLAEKSGGIGRWWSRLPDLLRQFPAEEEGRDNPVDDTNLLTALLLHRFLLEPAARRELPQPALIAPARLAKIMEAVSQENKKKPKTWRWLLILPPELAREYRHSLLVPGVEEENQKDFSKRLLASAVLFREAQAWQVEEEQRKVWGGKLLENLALISERRLLDSFLRLYLAEMLDDPIMAGDLELQTAMALAVLEWGTAYDIQNLIERLFVPLEKERRREATTARKRLRERVLAALLRYPFTALDDASRILGPINPWIIWLDLRRGEVLQKGLVGIISAALQDWHELQDNDARLLLQRFGDHLTREWQGQMQGLNWSTFDLTSREGSHLEKAQATVPSSAGMVLDVNNQRLHLLRDPARSLHPCSSLQTYPGVLNLFTASPQERGEFRENPPGEVRLAVVILYVTDDPGSGGDKKWIFLNLGLRFWTRVTMYTDEVREKKIKSRDFGAVDLDISRDSAGRPQFSYHHGSWSPFLPSLMEGAAAVLALEYLKVSPGVGSLPFRVWHQGMDITNAIDLEIWSPDVGGLFRRSDNEAGSRPYEVQCQLVEGRWEPIMRFLPELLARIFYERKHLAPALTLVRVAEDQETREHGWLFSYLEGENYWLSRSHFHPEDAEKLTRAMEDQEQAGGLLVTVHWDHEGQCLRLVGDDDGIPLDYDRTLPFDDRNLRWRRLFDDTPTLKAKWVHAYQRWTANLPAGEMPPGFVKTVTLNLEGPRPSPGSFPEVAIAAHTWRQDPRARRTAMLKGEVVTKSITFPKNPAERLRHLDAWLNLKRGDLLEIKRVHGSSLSDKDNLIPAETVGGPRVSVEVESLTMQVLPADDLGYCLSQPRLTQVVYPTNFALAGISPDLDMEELRRQLPELDQVEEIAGILKASPERGKGTQWTVAWRLAHDYVEKIVTVRNGGKLRARTGAILRGRRHRDRGEDLWKWTLELREVHVHALWRESPERAWQVGGSVIGRAFFRDAKKSKPLLETGPGEFTVLPPEVTSLPLARWGEGRFGDGLRPGTILHLTPDQSSHRGDHWRVGLRWGEKWFHAYTKRKPSTRKMAYQSQLMFAEPTDRPGYYRLTRQVQLAPHEEPRTEDKVDHQPKVLALREVFSKGEAVKADIQSEIVNLTNLSVPRSGRLDHLEEEIDWVRTIGLAPGQGRFVEFADYKASGQVCLLETADGILAASCRQVPPVELPKFYEDLDVPLGELWKFEDTVYYAGPWDALDDSRSRPDNPEDRMHLFEWGQGEFMAVPEKNLRFKGEKFFRGGLALCHGDRVTQVKFLEDGPEIILDIGDFTAYFYDTRELYGQSKDHFVHQIIISWKEGRSRIERVVGLDRESATATKKFYHRVNAALAPDDEGMFRHLLGGEDSRPRQFSILGRMDLDQVHASCGVRVLYRYVRPEFNQVQGLARGDVVFLEAQEIKDARNDCLLKLALPVSEDPFFPDRHRPDHPQQQVTVMRRDFSARQDRLSQIKEEQASDLVGSLLPVKIVSLHASKGPRGVIIGSSDRIPGRDISILGEITRPRYALVAADYSRGDSLISLELAPAVLVDLRFDERKYGIKVKDTSLHKGDRVLIRQEGSRNYVIQQASRGHRNFASEWLRPVVALPHNQLFRPEASAKLWPLNEVRRPEFWERTGMVSMGGLPDLKAMPGVKEKAQSIWGRPRPDHLERWMQQSHPKIVLVGRDRQGRARYVPVLRQPGRWPVGKLEIDEAALALRVVWFPLADRTGEQETSRQDKSRILEWNAATFADESARDIMRRLQSTAWRYHDRITVDWQAVEEQGMKGFCSRTYTIGGCSPQSGPLFFEMQDGRPVLRYTHLAVERFAFPVDELLADLKRQGGKPTAYTVAYANSSGLWVEMAPGRVAELPGAMCLWAKAGREQSLEHLDWRQFFTGDRVILELAPRDRLLEMDRFKLVDWRPGARGALGATGTGCFLPVQGYDAQEGALHLGGGRFSLCLPANGPLPTEVAVLERNNALSPAGGRRPQPGDVVLLTVGEANGSLRVAGFPELIPRPGNSVPASTNSMAAILMDQGALSKFLQILGGYLPVTVIGTEDHHLFFDASGTRQQSALEIGKPCFGRVAGWWEEGQRVILQVGARFSLMPLHVLVEGMPVQGAKEVVAALQGKNELVWLRLTEKGEIQTNFQDWGGGQDVRVHIMMSDITIPEQGGNSFGVLCQSPETGQLAWLPGNNATLIENLTQKEWQVIVARQGLKSIKVHRQTNGRLSVVDTRTITMAFDSCVIGRELPVQVIGLREQGGWLAWSHSVGAALQLVGDVNEEFQEAQRERRRLDQLAEVVHRKARPRTITVTPRAQRLYCLDVPGALGDQGWDGMNLDTALQKMLENPKTASLHEATRALQRLSRRAFRSRHLEILKSLWLLKNSTWRTREWIRLNNLQLSGGRIMELIAQPASASLKITDLQMIQDTIRAIELQTDLPTGQDIPEILVVAAALATAAGLQVNPKLYRLMTRKGEHLGKILTLGCCYFSCSSGEITPMLKQHQSNLQNLLNQILAYGLTIPLLPEVLPSP